MRRTAKKRSSRGGGYLSGVFKLPQIKQDFPKAAAVVGGVIIGRFINGQLDKIILSKGVGEFAGIEMQQNLVKFAKPALVTVAGLAGMGYGKKNHNDIIFHVGLGITAYGASGVLSAITNKSYLQGFGADDYTITDSNGNRLAALDEAEMKRLLPDLEGGESMYFPNEQINGSDDEDLSSLEGKTMSNRQSSSESSQSDHGLNDQRRVPIWKRKLELNKNLIYKPQRHEQPIVETDEDEDVQGFDGYEVVN